MRLQLIVHTALDELRMQMLGMQVLFGFQLQGAFQEGFDKISSRARILDVVALGLIVLTLGLLIAAPSQHRLVEQGNATRRILDVANRFAEIALATYAAALGLDLYIVAEGYWGVGNALAIAGSATVVAILLWYMLGLALRAGLAQKEQAMPKTEHTELHEKINQMLTEARVILPGAQALLGFQFVVTMTKAFAGLPVPIQIVHFCALAAVALSVMLLISPAAVHRVTFGGRDAEKMHDIGSLLVTLALVPLAAGIAGDVYVAVAKVLDTTVALSMAVASLLVLVALWYALPLGLRAVRDDGTLRG